MNEDTCHECNVAANRRANVVKIPCDGAGLQGEEFGLLGAVCIGCGCWRQVDSSGRIPPHLRELSQTEVLARHVQGVR